MSFINSKKSKEIFKQLKLNHPHIKIFGSLPPFFPSYKYKPVNDEFKQFYKTLIPVLNQYVDEFLIETAISIEHINCICTIYQDLNIDKKMNVEEGKYLPPINKGGNNVLFVIDININKRVIAELSCGGLFKKIIRKK